MSNTTYELTIYIAGSGARLQEGGTSAAGHIWYQSSPSAANDQCWRLTA